MSELAVNERFFDQYSVAHAAVGAGFGLVGVGAPLALGAHVGFEAIENELKRRRPDMWPDARMDGWQNQSGDMVSFIVGYSFARTLPIAWRLGAAGALGALALVLWRAGMKNKRTA